MYPTSTVNSQPSQPPFIFVTGGTSFLGSHIVQQLLEEGYRVRCTARPLKYHFLQAAHVDKLRSGQLEVVEVNDLAMANLDGVLEGITAVIHTAFPAPGSKGSTELLLNGTSSTTSLLRQAYDHGIRKFVLTSSYLAMTGAYKGIVNEEEKGVWSAHTFSDRDWTHATYESVFNGSDDILWTYAAAKTLAEAAAWDFASARPDFDLATVLPTLLLGPFAPGHAIFSSRDLSTNVLLHTMLTSGTVPQRVWPYFVDVRDAARAHIRALEAPSLCGYASGTSTNPHAKLETETSGQPGREPEPSSSAPSLSPGPALSSKPSLLDFGSMLQELDGTLGSPGVSLFTTALSSLDSIEPTSRSASPSPTTPPAAGSHPTGTHDLDTPTHNRPHTPSSTFFSLPPRKRFVASGACFTWPDAIAHLRTVRPDLLGSLPDEGACLPLPEEIAGVDGEWSGAGWATGVELRLDGDAVGMRGSHVAGEAVGESDARRRGEGEGVWKGLAIRWRDWHETVEDAVRDLERVADVLERSGWDELFGDGGDEEEEEGRGCIRNVTPKGEEGRGGKERVEDDADGREEPRK